MSEARHFSGKLVYLEKNSPTESIEQQCKRIFDAEIPEWADSYQEALLDEYYQEYIVHEGKLYAVKDRIERDEDEDIFRMKKINGTDREFEVRYYNGGCSFDEAIDEAFKNLA